MALTAEQEARIRRSIVMGTPGACADGVHGAWSTFRRTIFSGEPMPDFQICGRCGEIATLA